MISEPGFSIEAIRYGTMAQFPLATLVVGSDDEKKIDIPAVFWLVRNRAHCILFDCGFYRQPWIDIYHATDLVRPDQAVRLAGIEPEQITDIIISHAHFDHTGGIDLFPQATLWIEQEEYSYYTGPAWQEGRVPRAIDHDDILHLVHCNLEGKLVLIDGDDREIFPGIHIYTGGRHTYASAFIRIAGDPPYVLASDNCYLYANLETHAPVKTFAVSDHSANLRALQRMITLAGKAERVIPGHDALVFKRFPTTGRIAKIR